MDEEKPNKFLNKKWILIILALIIIIGGLIYLLTPTVDTDLYCYDIDPSSSLSDYGSVNVVLKYNITNESGTYDEVLENKTVYVNLTDSKNVTKEYNVTINGSFGKIDNVRVGKYNLSAYFPGDTKYKPSSYNTTININRYVPQNISYYTLGNKTYYTVSPTYYTSPTIYKTNYTYRTVYEPRYVVRYVYV